MVAAGVAFCLHVWLAARSAVAEGAQVAAFSGQAGVTVSTFRSKASKFEPVLIAPEFRSAVQFSSDVFISGSSALFDYSGGELKKTWYAGHDLPRRPSAIACGAQWNR